MSIALRNLKSCKLKKAIQEKQPNGVVKDSYCDVSSYNVSIQELTDEVSASIYGANIIRTYRVMSPLKALEKFLFTKLNNTPDNISKYYLFIDGKQYKIVSVRTNWVDVELI